MTTEYEPGRIYSGVVHGERRVILFDGDGCCAWVDGDGDMLPFILDPACGGRQFYFDKNDDRVLFGDIRVLDKVTLTNQQTYEVQPDQVMDYRALPFDDETFRVVVFDPPHSTRAGKTGWLATKYGSLDKLTWRDDLRAGFTECFRVLQMGGLLIFKWAESDVPVSQVLELTDQRPLLGHKSGKRMGTHWITFIKEPVS